MAWVLLKYAATLLKRTVPVVKLLWKSLVPVVKSMWKKIAGWFEGKGDEVIKFLKDIMKILYESWKKGKKPLPEADQEAKAEAEALEDRMKWFEGLMAEEAAAVEPEEAAAVESEEAAAVESEEAAIIWEEAAVKEAAAVESEEDWEWERNSGCSSSDPFTWG